jgi:hypothetical protein
MLAASNIRAIGPAESTSETSVNFYETARRNNPEDSHFLCLTKSFLAYSF